MARLPKEFEELNTPTNKLKRLVKKMMKWFKLGLFVAIILLTFRYITKIS